MSECVEEQARRLRSLVGEIVQCCHERQGLETERFGLPAAELRCLVLFEPEGYLTAGQLANHLDVGKSRVSRLVESLLQRGLLDSVEDRSDRRVKLLKLSRAGRAKVAEIDDFILKMHCQVLELLEPTQRTGVLATLEMLWSSMQVVKRTAQDDGIGS